jgi:hypothetical protein
LFVSLVPSVAIHFRDLLLELTRPFKQCQAKVSCRIYIGICNESIKGGDQCFLILFFLAFHAASEAKEELLEQVKEVSRNSDVSQKILLAYVLLLNLKIFFAGTLQFLQMSLILFKFFFEIKPYSAST